MSKLNKASIMFIVSGVIDVVVQCINSTIVKNNIKKEFEAIK